MELEKSRCQFLAKEAGILYEEQFGIPIKLDLQLVEIMPADSEIRKQAEARVEYFLELIEWAGVL